MARTVRSTRRAHVAVVPRRLCRARDHRHARDRRGPAERGGGATTAGRATSSAHLRAPPLPDASRQVGDRRGGVRRSVQSKRTTEKAVRGFTSQGFRRPHTCCSVCDDAGHPVRVGGRDGPGRHPDGRSTSSAARSGSGSGICRANHSSARTPGVSRSRPSRVGGLVDPGPQRVPVHPEARRRGVPLAVVGEPLAQRAHEVAAADARRGERAGAAATRRTPPLPTPARVRAAPRPGELAEAHERPVQPRAASSAWRCPASPAPRSSPIGSDTPARTLRAPPRSAGSPRHWSGRRPRRRRGVVHRREEQRAAPGGHRLQRLEQPAVVPERRRNDDHPGAVGAAAGPQSRGDRRASEPGPSSIVRSSAVRSRARPVRPRTCASAAA